MVAGNTEDSGLGSARGRFVDSLPRKAIELRGAVALLTETPSAEGPREDMRQRLHALYGSALVFRNDVLARAVLEGIERLERARDTGRALVDEDLALLTSLVIRLPELRGEEREPSSEASARELASDGHARAPALSAEARPLLQRVLRVLLLCPRAEQRELSALLLSESLRVTSAANVDEALASARDDTPDLVLADEQLARAGGLVHALRADPSTDFVPVVLLASAQADGARAPLDGADRRVARPFVAQRLVEAIGRATGTLIEPLEAPGIGEVTLDELAERLGRELRRGLVDSAEAGRSERIAFGAGGEVLATACAAIAELRAAVIRESAGRVQFEPSASRGSPALVGGGPGEVRGQTERVFAGRRVVLVEDDTAIVLLLANLLREHGATVHEFTDGREARDAARRERPDLVITGAQLPSLDGFSLCRELYADPLLAGVPVLLLPSKEQLLVRSKEPAASSQLRRELAEQVLVSAERLLRPRAELEARLKQPGELRGNLEGTGVVALLRSVRRTRPDARVRIRDAWNLFECELREGRLAQLTRTACDGSFVRNERALPQLLGAIAGRFSVVEEEAALKVSFAGTLDEVLTRGARDLAGELDAVSGASVARIARVVFDEDAYALLREQTPPVVRQVIERLYAGEAPSKLLERGEVTASTLEPILLDMARRGALRGVIGNGGEDLVDEARVARLKELPAAPLSPLSLVPPAPNPVISVLPPPAPAEASEPLRTVAGSLPLALVGDARSLAHDARERSNGAPAGLPPGLATGVAPQLAEPAREARADPELPATARPAARAAPGAAKPARAERDERAVPADPEPRAPHPPARVREASVSEASEIAAALVEARRSRSTLVAWTVALFALAAIGYFVAREPGAESLPIEAIGGAGSPPVTSLNKPGALSPRHKGGSLISAEDNGFAVYDEILDRTAPVPTDHAQLIVELTPGVGELTVFINDRELGPPPQQVSLPEGVHELAIKRGDAISYRFVSVHPGRTWVLRNP